MTVVLVVLNLILLALLMMIFFLILLFFSCWTRALRPASATRSTELSHSSALWMQWVPSSRMEQAATWLLTCPVGRGEQHMLKHSELTRHDAPIDSFSSLRFLLLLLCWPTLSPLAKVCPAKCKRNNCLIKKRPRYYLDCDISVQGARAGSSISSARFISSNWESNGVCWEWTTDGRLVSFPPINAI